LGTKLKEKLEALKPEPYPLETRAAEKVLARQQRDEHVKQLQEKYVDCPRWLVSASLVFDLFV
jgi:hypothetical protein